MHELTERIYEIPTALLDDLTERIAKLNKKAEKLGAAPIALAISDAWMKRVQTRPADDPLFDPQRDVVLREVVSVQVFGEAPQLNGWQFAATIQHDEIAEGEGANLLRHAPGFEIDLPEAYRTTSPDLCEHCHTHRARRDTYIVFNAENGEFKQVGSSCLADFTGAKDPHKIAAWLEILLDLDAVIREYEDDGGLGGRGEYSYPLMDFLSMSVAMIEKFGWLSRSKAKDMLPYPGYATADRAADQFGNSHLRPEERVTPTVVHRERAEQALAWARETWQPEGGLSDYEWTMYVVLAKDYVEHKKTGYAASVLSAYQRATERDLQNKLEAERKGSAANQFMGEIGQKKFQVVGTVTKEIVFTEGFGGAKYIFETADGNTFTWSTNSTRLYEGTTYVVVGTIKDHTEWHGVNQTVLTRCKVTEVAESAAVPA